MSTEFIFLLDAEGNKQPLVFEKTLTGLYTPHNVLEVGGVLVSVANPLPTSLVVGGAAITPSNPIPTSGAALSPTAPTGGGGFALAVAGQSQIFTASMDGGGWIQNPSSGVDQGVGSQPESIFVDMTGAEAIMAFGGTSFEIKPGGILQFPGRLLNSVNWIAATAGHVINGMVF